MGNVIPMLGGGGGASSDECTGYLNDVIKGKKVIAADTNDEVGTGTLELTGNMVAADLLSEKTGYGTNPKSKITGTMPNQNNANNNGSARLLVEDGKVKMYPKAGYYGGYTANGPYYVWDTQALVAERGGLTTAKLATGQSAFGLNGTYKGLGNAVAADVRKGKTFSTAHLSNATGIMPEQGGSTTTPGTANKTVVPANRFVTGNIIVAGDPNLKPANIKKDITIFGVRGTYAPHEGLKGSATSGSTLKTFSAVDDDVNPISRKAYLLTVTFKEKYWTGTYHLMVNAINQPTVGKIFMSNGLGRGYSYSSGGIFTNFVEGGEFIMSSSGFSIPVAAKNTEYWYYIVPKE